MILKDLDENTNNKNEYIRLLIIIVIIIMNAVFLIKNLLEIFKK